jgi:hypothetical protein
MTRWPKKNLKKPQELPDSVCCSLEPFLSRFPSCLGSCQNLLNQQNERPENMSPSHHTARNLKTHWHSTQFTVPSVYLHRPIAKSNPLPEVISPCNVAIERLGIELGENVDLVYLAVYAVAHRDVNEPVASPDRHLKPSLQESTTTVTSSRLNQWGLNCNR